MRPKCKRKTYLLTRRFLNSDKSLMAYIGSEFILDYWIGEKKKRTYIVDGSIKLSDCNRNITLDLSGRRKKDLKAALHKLDVLERTVRESRNALIKMHKIVAKLE